MVLLDRSEYKTKVNKFLEKNVNFSKLGDNPLDKIIKKKLKK